MRYLVTAKQPNSKMCLVCGLKNSAGLHSSFYQLESGELLAIFTPTEEHQSYPGRLHGGIATAILDETIGRAIMIDYPEEVWGVTVEFTTRYKQPIPLNGKIRVVGRIIRETSRYFEGTGEILLEDGSIAAEGRGKFLKLALEEIADFDADAQEWRIVRTDDDPQVVDI